METESQRTQSHWRKTKTVVTAQGGCRPRPWVTKSGNSAPRCLSVALGREESDDYPRIVARLNDDWRVICCRNDIQWVLQSRWGQRDGQPTWRGRYFFRTRQALVDYCHQYAGEIGGDARVILSRLPARFAERSP